MLHKRSSPPMRLIRLWLIACCLLIFLMILLGGITRLTESGLSIVDWRPITGWIPPLNASDWTKLFTAYQASSEFQKLNFWMDIADFKNIFWLEYLHRLLGRIIGIIYGLPLLWFAARYQLGSGLTARLVSLFVMGGVQGGLGWYMVKSGLVKETSVNHYLLAAHLGLAVTIYGVMLFIATQPKRRSKHAVKPALARAFTALVFLTIVWGAFVSGLDGGAVFNTFPLMDGSLIPPSALAISPLWLNFFDNIGLVQWIHRVLAIATLCMAVWLSFRYRHTRLHFIHLSLFITFLQFVLGITTILTGASLYVAWAHQGGAILLFSSSVIIWAQSSRYSNA